MCISLREFIVFFVLVVRNGPRQNSCSFVGSFLVSFVSRRLRFPQKEHINNPKVVAERGSCVVKVLDLVANKVPREEKCLRTSTIPTRNDYEEDFGELPIRIQK